nr:hypothetical protein [Qipengyuania seohaensis]
MIEMAEEIMRHFVGEGSGEFWIRVPEAGERIADQHAFAVCGSLAVSALQFETRGAQFYRFEYKRCGAVPILGKFNMQPAIGGCFRQHPVNSGGTFPSLAGGVGERFDTGTGNGNQCIVLADSCLVGGRTCGYRLDSYISAKIEMGADLIRTFVGCRVVNQQSDTLCLAEAKRRVFPGQAEACLE